jgi:hypothetical protein
MKKEWFERLSNIGKHNEQPIGIAELRPYIYNRTLLYGYTCERETFHVYIKNKQIYVIVYNTEYYRGGPRPVNMRQIEVKSNRDYVPDKRLYPERCDYHFCKLLKEKGIDLPFTAFTEGFNWDGTYCGFTLEDAE